MNAIITQATLSDIPTINELANAIWPTAYKDVITQEQITYMLHKMYDSQSLRQQMIDGDDFFLLEANGVNIGFASISYDAQPQYTKLNKLYVLTDKHQKGYGSMLVDYIINKAKRRGQKALFLQVNRNNKAVNFYKKHGFEIWKEKDFDIGNGFWMNDYIMKFDF